MQMFQGTQLFTAEVGGRTLAIESGLLAPQAGGAVTVRYGDTVLLATAVMSKEGRPGLNFFPLTVEFEERLYAAGRIPGSFFRREGKPSEQAILMSRLVDRPLRPLFPKGMRNEVQVIVTAMATDGQNLMDPLAIIAASAALHVSDIPWNGPIAATTIGFVDGEFVVNPTAAQMEHSSLSLVAAGTEDNILMVEAGAHEMPEDLVLEALKLAHENNQIVIKAIHELRAALGKPKAPASIFLPSPEVETEVATLAVDKIAATLEQGLSKVELNNALDAIKAEVKAAFAERVAEGSVSEIEVDDAFESVLKNVMRRRILEKGIRPDGRTTTQIRPVSVQVGNLPRVHGSGLFMRGETHVLTIATLGTPADAQRLDSLLPGEEKRYMHHYNFPPYSTGEATPIRGPRRREIGHGALAERALVPVIPEDFPYTLRLVSEVLSSNGSTSMGSVCGSTLALMDAGVPITAPVSGIAMGLVQDMETGEYQILSDIQGMEDALGDMDFKVAGTEHGITALQMDLKIKGLDFEILRRALEQAREGRLYILSKMLEVLPAPRPTLSVYAPRILSYHIDPEKIGKLIGPGGKTVRGLQEQFSVKIDIEEDGTVYISGEGLNAEQALVEVQRMTEDVEIGKIYTGTVVRVEPYGAFVNIMPGVDGMVHISQLADYRVEKVEDVAKLGDELTAMVIDVDPGGKVRLSRQAVLEGWSVEEARSRDRSARSRSSERGDRGERGERGERGNGRSGDRREQRGGGRRR
ncbi:MAG: polyribonucleotide nucleotidyltransferase [Caldilinea sp.]|uniref:polyribonucleotide nucleotidyltransferase n=1 Tax=Caldilinea sp. TaxID=2293560 RepID=UPI0030B46814